MDLRGLAAASVDLVLPADCAGCGAALPPWCPSCRAQLGPAAWPYLPGGPAVFAAGRYTGPLRTGLLRYKERGRRDLAEPLAALLADGLREVLGPVRPGHPPVVLVPAPSRAAAARARGGDHVARICRVLAAQRPDLRVARPLRLSRRVRDSVGLGAAERAANLAGGVRVRAAALRGGEVSGPVLLVDDVVTTGATLRACRNALANAGVPVAAAVVLCDATAGTSSSR